MNEKTNEQTIDRQNHLKHSLARIATIFIATLSVTEAKVYTIK